MKNSAHEYEVGLLGLILSDEKIFHNITGRLVPEDFLDNKHRILFKTITTIYDNGFEDIEMLPLINHLKSNNLLEKVGGKEYLAELIQRPALVSNMSNYMREIAASSDLRKVSAKIKKLNQDIENDSHKSAEDIMQKVELDILETARNSEVKTFVESKDAIEKTIEKIENKAKGKAVSGVSIGYPSIDKMTGGFQNGDLVILAARPSMGKTALALNMAANASLKHNVAFFSLEMPIEQLYNRIISFTAYVDQNKLREAKYLSKNEWDKIYASKSKIKKMNLFINDTAGIKLAELVWQAKRLHKNGKLDIIFIDYLQLIVVANQKGDNRQNEVSIISRTLKKLARDLNVPVIALSQLSRRVEQRESKVPMMSDLRESGAIEQDADIVSFIYRDAYYNKKDTESDHGKEFSDIIISKHRNGATGNIKIFFKPENGLFIEKGE